MTTKDKQLVILSLGAGVQSTAMLLMSLKGELPPVDHVIFADTQDEPEEVYKHLAKLEIECDRAGVPFHTVTAGKLSDNIATHDRATHPGRRFITFPVFGSEGGIGRRHCTREFKVDPIQKKCRELAGVAKGKRMTTDVEKWIGITLDEVQRMKPSPVKWEKVRWPLIEKRFTRHDCITWMEKHNWTATKSACVYCPYHGNAEWRRIKAMPKDWAKVVDIDRKLNKRGEYLHRTLIPIDQVDLSTDLDRGQLSLFANDCEGMCGV